MSATDTLAVNGSRAAVERNRGIILDLGCGRVKQPGAVGMDARPLPGVDIVHDWKNYPWPLGDESVLTIIAVNVVEHVNPADSGFLRWMDECWRILKPERQMAIVTPYAGSPVYYADPTHVNPCTHMTWWYFDPDIRVKELAGERSLYGVYEPAPWKIQFMTFKTAGMMELALAKRPDRAEYHADEEVHYP